jgi:hypothetical protein
VVFEKHTIQYYQVNDWNAIVVCWGDTDIQLDVRKVPGIGKVYTYAGGHESAGTVILPMTGNQSPDDKYRQKLGLTHWP